MKTHKPDVFVDNADEAKALLTAGNERFLSGDLQNKDSYSDDLGVLEGGQKPFATILTCSDSRVSPEIFFDQKLGDIFVIRNAGNVVDDTVLGSIEYAAEHLECPLVVVVGHSSCGAVTAAVSKADVTEYIQKIMETVTSATGDETDVDKAIDLNTKSVVDEIKENPVVEKMGTTVVGAHFDIASGKVSWL